MKTLIVQKDITNPKIKPFLDMAKEANADLICFGELATSGCLYIPRKVEPIEHWLTIFSQYSFRIMCGIPFYYPESGEIANTYVYFHNGEYQVYQKMHLFSPMNEDKVFKQGTEPGLFKTDLGRFGAAICYDIRFSEYFDKLKILDPDIVFIPAAFPRVRIDDWKRLLVERALQCDSPVVGINSAGNDGTNEFGGSSAYVSARGEVLASADEVSETVLEVDIEID